MVSPLVDTFFPPIDPGHPIPADLQQPAPAAADQYPARSSPWWIERLMRDMALRNERMIRLRSYYRGENDTWRLANKAHRDTFGTAFRDLRANYAEPVVEIPGQRLKVDGFTLAGDPDGEAEAWRLWIDNDMPALATEAHNEVLSVGHCAIIVGPADDDPRTPLITVEDPVGVIVETDPANRRRRLAALKSWVEDDERLTAILYLPDRIEWWRTESRAQIGSRRTWAPVPGKSQQNPLGVVPVIELDNSPRRRAEHEVILGHLDLYAKTLYDMATTGDHMAFPQRYASGVDSGEEGTEKDADGNPTSTEAASFEAGPNRVWTSEDPDARFGQLPAADLTAFVRTLEAYRSDIASLTHTPHRLIVPPPTSVPPSGESVRLSETGLTAKVRDKHDTLGPGWARVIRLAFLVQRDVRRAAASVGTSWRDPETRTEAEHVDALSKLAAMGVPREELWRRAGATPLQIRQWAAAAPQPPTIPESGPTPEGES